MNYLLCVYYLNELLSHIHDKFLVGFVHLGEGGEKKTCSNSPNTTLKYCQACIPEMSVVLHGARNGSLEEQKSQDCNWSNFCLLELIGDMRKGVNFNVLSPGSHTSYLLRVGWLMCVSASWAASSLFQFHLSRQGFGLPHSGRQCEISYLDLIVLCRAYFRENTCSLRAGIQGELQMHSTSEDLDLCPWQVLLGAAFAVSQWISTLWNDAFPSLDPFR